MPAVSRGLEFWILYSQRNAISVNRKGLIIVQYMLSFLCVNIFSNLSTILKLNVENETYAHNLSKENLAESK